MSVRARWRPSDATDGIPVLLFHSVADAPPPGQEARFTVSRSRFREHLGAIVAGGATALTIPELAAALRGERTLPERALAVTIDDGFDDSVDAVVALREAGLSGTVYVTTGAVGTPSGISVTGLTALAEAAEIGAHTVSHPHLDELDPASVAIEVRRSREALEDHLARPVTTFAYPHGAHDRHVRDAVIDAGFTSAVAVKNALSHRGDDPFAIARWTVTRDTDARALAALLEGRGAPLAWSRERYRTRAYRTARHLRQRLRDLGTSGAERPR
jgi:peptidoglycan/xylan/chitin deacetylase (PgdA/CDA1 family)